MRTKRFVVYWILLVVTTLSIGVVAFLSLRREGETIRARAEEARKVAVGYQKMAKYSAQMAKYAEERADYAMASRARTIADNLALLMTDLKDGLMQSLHSFPEEEIAHELTRWKKENHFVHEVFLWPSGESLALTGKSIVSPPKPADFPLFCRDQAWVWKTPHSNAEKQNDFQEDRQLAQQSDPQDKPDSQLEKDL
ncbi:MAG: hypothetical protein VCA36_11320, partial [Opitutales bacterium]